MDKQGQWLRESKNGLTIVFIHGINSDEECWRSKSKAYWPDLLKKEENLQAIGIYIFSYRTGINTGTYSLSDIVDSLREYLFTLDEVLRSSRVIFVCHSMGGIVARRFLVKEQIALIEQGIKTIGLYLLASPSLGADYANMLSLVSGVLGHTQASALKFSQQNIWLNDLDKDFINLKESEKVEIIGKELIEDLPLYGKGIFKKQVVQPFQGAKYFGQSFKVPGSDHNTIAKPESDESVQHRLLVKFIEEFEASYKSSESASSKPQEPSPSSSPTQEAQDDLNNDQSQYQENNDQSTGYQINVSGGTVNIDTQSQH